MSEFDPIACELIRRAAEDSYRLLCKCDDLGASTMFVTAGNEVFSVRVASMPPTKEAEEEAMK